MRKKPRLRLYIFLSLLIHILVWWSWRFLPASTPPSPLPVTVRLLDTPPVPRTPPVPPPRREAHKQPAPPPPPPPESPQKQPPPPQVNPQPPPKQQGGLVVDLPKPVHEERPDQARIVSRYDSKAQDVGPGESGTHKPSGAKPPPAPPELALPERHSTQPSTRPQASPPPPEPPAAAQVKPPPVAPQPSPPPRPAPEAPQRARPVKPPQAPGVARVTPRKPQPMPPTPNASEVARLAPEARPHPPAPVEQAPEAPVRQESGRDAAPAAQELTPEERRFQMTLQQELAMLHREQQPIGPSKAERKQALAEHFAQLEKRRLQPSFDAPGVYEPGPDRAGEGQNDGPGGKYRSIGSYGIKHFSYLLSLQRKIELVFSVPPFAPTNGAIGVPIVGFTIMRNGQLAEAILLRSSGYPVLDKALVDAVKRAAPYNPFPEHLPDPSISIRVYANVS